MSLSHHQQSPSNGPRHYICCVSPQCASCRHKRLAFRKELWRKGLAPPSCCHASVPLGLRQEVLTLLLHSPSQWMFASPWRLQLSSLLLQPCVRDFGGLFYCVPLCDAVPACGWQPCEEMLDTQKPLPGFGEVFVCAATCASGVISTFYACARLFLAFFLSFFYLFWTQNPVKKHLSTTRERRIAAGRRQSLLVCATMLSSPVSCQNRK